MACYHIYIIDEHEILCIYRLLIIHYVFPAVTDDTNPLHTYASCKANWWFPRCKLYVSSAIVHNIGVDNIQCVNDIDCQKNSAERYVTLQ